MTELENLKRTRESLAVIKDQPNVTKAIIDLDKAISDIQETEDKRNEMDNKFKDLEQKVRDAYIEKLDAAYKSEEYGEAYEILLRLKGLDDRELRRGLLARLWFGI